MTGNGRKEICRAIRAGNRTLSVMEKKKRNETDQNGKNSVKGVRIHTINFGMLLMASIIYLLILYATIHLSLKYEELNTATENYVACVRQAGMVTEASEYLTMKARMYAVNRKIEHVQDYFTEIHVTRRREAALEELEKYNGSQEAYDFLKTALDKSNELMNREMYSMKLVAEAMGHDTHGIARELDDIQLSHEDQKLDSEAMLKKAEEMVFDTAYQDAKALITRNISYFLNHVVETTKKQRTDNASMMQRIMNTQKLYIGLLFVLSVINLALIISLIVKPLRVYIRCIKDEKRLPLEGAYEFQYLALTYNHMYDANAENEAALRYKADHDALTDLINRGGFDQICKSLETQNRKIALLLIDVDRFKQVNDGNGHRTGDRILKKVAGLLRNKFRSKDYVARVGGDEFSIIMMDVGPDMSDLIEKKIESINQVLRNPEDGLPEVSLSVGVAFSQDGYTGALYRNADIALYQVKENGRCGCDFYQG